MVVASKTIMKESSQKEKPMEETTEIVDMEISEEDKAKESFLLLFSGKLHAFLIVEYLNFLNERAFKVFSKQMLI